MKKLTHEQVIEIITAFKSGTSITRLADLYTVRRTTIRWHLKVAGISKEEISRPAKPSHQIPTTATVTPAQFTKPSIPKLKKPPTVKREKAPLCEFCLIRPAAVKEIEGRITYSPCTTCTAALADDTKKFFDPPREYVQFKPLSPPKEELDS